MKTAFESFSSFIDRLWIESIVNVDLSDIEHMLNVAFNEFSIHELDLSVLTTVLKHIQHLDGSESLRVVGDIHSLTLTLKSEPADLTNTYYLPTKIPSHCSTDNLIAHIPSIRLRLMSRYPGMDPLIAMSAHMSTVKDTLIIYGGEKDE